MYSNKLIACVKANGKVLREKGENVYLPFGSEYTLWFKNEHSRKVRIEVSIDGTDALFGKALILDPNDTMDLKGFVRDLEGDDNRAFKFITKTQEISDFRGDKIEDGLIKITYQFEKEKPQIDTIEDHIYHKTIHHYHDYRHQPYWIDKTPNWPYHNPIICGSKLNANDDPQNNVFTSSMGVQGENGPQGPSGATFSTQSVNKISDNNSVLRSTSIPDNAVLGSASINSSFVADDPGITVEGSGTGQSFNVGGIGILESKIHTMVFSLKGLTENEEVAKPVTVESKKQCPSCGKKWKSTFEYCPHDGTFLRFP